MSHGEAWEFFQLGKNLERACQTARILDVKYHILLPAPDQVGTPVDNAHWVAILTSCSGYEPYHKKHRATADPGSAVADFLFFDPLFPRSVRRCVAECLRATHAISGGDGEVERLLNELHDWLSRTDIRAVIRAGLHESLLSVVSRIHAIGEAIRRYYFDARVEAQQHMTNGRSLQTQSQNGPVQNSQQSATQEQ